MKRLFILIALLCAARWCLGYDNMTVSHLGVERGLSNNHVVGMAQDKLGFIWIATEEGLNRFDGHTFKTFLKEEGPDTNGMTGNELNDIMDDPERPLLWIATQRAGLNAYNYEKDEFIIFRHDSDDAESLATDDVTSLSAASDGGVWVTTFWRGIDHLDPETGKFRHYSPETVKGLPDAPVWAVLDTGDGFLYVAHQRGGLSIIDLSHMTARNFLPEAGNPMSLPSSDIQCLYKDSLDNVWLGCSTGLVLFNRDDGTFTDFGKIHPLLNHAVSDIKQFSGNQLWVAMERGGLARLELSDSVYSHPELAESASAVEGMGQLSSSSLRCLFQDGYSNIWAGSWGGGLNLISPGLPAFRLHASAPLNPGGEVISSNSVMTVAFDDDRRLWIGKDGGGIDVYDGGTRVASYRKGDAGLAGDIVQSSYKDAGGNLWLGTFGAGAYRFDRSKGRFTQVFTGGPHTDVRDIVQGADGDMIFGTSTGIWVLDSGSGKMEGPIHVGDNLIRRVFPMEGGKYLVGTFGEGLFVTDSLFRELEHLYVVTGLPSNTINDIFRSRDGHIWVATGEGLLEYPDIAGNSSDYRVYNRASGMRNAHVRAIAQDRSGSIWVSTNGGISCIREGKIYNYTHRDHVPLGNFLGHSVATDAQGNIYFGSISGLCVFNPVKVLEEGPAPEPVIVEISVMNASESQEAGRKIQIAGKAEVRLKAGQNSLDISFTTRNFAHAREVEYAYMLEGLDDRWTVADKGNSAIFRDLAPGRYVFKVRARVRNQEWGEPAELKIVIPPPFYLSWWAKTLTALVLAVVVGVLLYLYYKRVNAEAQLKAEKERNKREQELNDERLRFYTNITHELRTPLTLITGPLEDLSKGASLSEKDRRSLVMVNRNAERLLDLVNRLLEFRKTETQNRRLCVRKGNMAATVYEVALKYKELNRNGAVEVNVSTEKDYMEGVYDKEVVTVILDNLISNAMKYTSEGSVTVECREDNGHVELRVADTGLGMSPETVPHIFERYYQERGAHQAAGTGIGLALVKNLVGLHHGVIAVKTAEGKGTEFMVTIPVADPYPEALHPEDPEPASGNENVDETAMPEGAERKPLLLVVEDNADIRDYIKQSFTDLYEVRTAEDGSKGLKSALRIMPDVIVSDIMMPVMDGIQMTRELKKDVRTSHIPVILLTAKETSSDREEGYSSGADSYLTKPFSSTLLQTRINNLLLQRMKLVERYSSRPAPAPEAKGESLEEKHERLMKALSDVDRTFLDKLTSTITSNVQGENLDVNFLAGVFCMSTSTLYRKVKALTGLSPNEFIRKTKMQVAESLLLDGKYTFSEIAFKVGISSVPYFRSCFKDEFGMTPTEYMKRVKF